LILDRDEPRGKLDFNWYIVNPKNLFF
jgi:hypothetical protein